MKIFYWIVFITAISVWFSSCTFIEEYWEPSDIMNSLVDPGDQYPPGLVISYPYGKGQEIPINYTISGTAKDTESGINAVYIQLNNGTNMLATYQSNDYSWSLDISVSRLGLHTNKVTAVDGKGNTSDEETCIVFCMPEQIYVSSAKGNDTNSGFFPTQPILSIDRGIALAEIYQLTNILLESGTYTSGNGLPAVPTYDTEFNVYIPIIYKTNLNLIGGWNSNFTSINGMSKLDSQNMSVKPMVLRGCEDIKIYHFWFTGAYVTNDFKNGGAGLEINYSQRIFLTNIVVSNNYCSSMGNSYANGGGILLFYSKNIDFYGTVVDNGTSTEGGGVYCKSVIDLDLNGLIQNNYASQGGGVFLRDTFSSDINAHVISNQSESEGGGLTCHYSASIDIEGDLINNIVTDITNSYGGGASFNTCMMIDVFGDVLGNICSNIGGGLYFSDCQVVYYKSDILSNVSRLEGAAFSLSNTPFLQMDNCLLDYNQTLISNNSILHRDDTSYISFLPNCRIGLSNTEPYLYPQNAIDLYYQMFVRGSFNSWSTNNNMTNTQPHFWEIDLTNMQTNDMFKFEVGGGEAWSDNFGDTNGDGICEFNSENIIIGKSGNIHITFHDLTKQYTINTN